MNKKKTTLFIFLSMVLVACQFTGPSASELAATMVAQTAEAAPPTATQTTTPTETLPPPTSTITPTSAPTLTPTPSGPLVIKDDFTSKSDIWGECEKCEWKDDMMYVGPFPPRGDGIDQLFAIICEACGEHTYFRIAADLTFADGVAGDREFGVGLTSLGNFMIGSGIAPSQVGALEMWNIQTNGFFGKFKRYNAIKPGTATNRVEFAIKRNGAGSSDYYFIVNGQTLNVLNGLLKGSTTGLKPSIYLGWHSVGITVDNFEYEEIVP